MFHALGSHCEWEIVRLSCAFQLLGVQKVAERRIPHDFVKLRTTLMPDGRLAVAGWVKDYHLFRPWTQFLDKNGVMECPAK